MYPLFFLCPFELLEVNSEAACMQHNAGEPILQKGSQNIQKKNITSKSAEEHKKSGLWQKRRYCFKWQVFRRLAFNSKDLYLQ